MEIGDASMISNWLKAMFIALVVLFLIVMIPSLITDLPVYIENESIRTTIFLMLMAVIIFFIMMMIIKF